MTALAVILCVLLVPGPVQAQVTAFKQAVAEAAARDADIAEFYKSNGYESLWTDPNRDRQRRSALIAALSSADAHGLPSVRYDLAGLRARLSAARSPRDLGLLEVEMSRTFLSYARDLQTGVLVPAQVDKAIVRTVSYRDSGSYLSGLAQSSAEGFFRSLVPKTVEYTGLMKEKLEMEQLLSRGGWGPTVPAKSLEPGQSGAAVVALRNRLVAMGFMDRSAGQVYDADMQAAVQQFQVSHGLTPDGVAGSETMAEINIGVEQRLQSVIVAMERERWFGHEREDRYVLVNLPDFTAKLFENGREAFSTRAVVGANKSDRRSPEFSDVMEFMIINPSWYVPRSIVTKEYLPALQQNPNAAGHLVITDQQGRQINRGAVDFTQYNARNFPFAMRQPPSDGNALGLVKFMFPNPYNIYLHDTPAKNLFGRETRAYSHGCIRLADPFDFAYALLSSQSSDPKGLFQSRLASGGEQRVDLEHPLPVHIIYRTAFTTPRGHTQFRRDVYGRDASIWEALSKAGVALGAVQG